MHETTLGPLGESNGRSDEKNSGVSRTFSDVEIEISATF